MDTDQLYYVFDNNCNGWLCGPNSQGVTGDLRHARLYSHKEACDLCFTKPEYVMEAKENGD